MYTKTIPYKDLKGKPRNDQVQLHLAERDVIKLLVELQKLFKWLEAQQGGEFRELPAEEIVEFYDNLEAVLLAAWGEMSEDGLHFRRAGRYDFEDSALFNALMMTFVTDTQEGIKMLNDIMPDGMEEMVKTAELNLDKAEKNPENTDEMKAEIARLKAELAKSSLGSATPDVA